MTGRPSRKLLRPGLIVVGLALTLAGSGVALTAGNGGGSVPTLGLAELVPMLHRINEMEIEAGKLAERNGASPAMRAFGEKLRRDHAAADSELGDYAALGPVDINGTVRPDVSNDLDHAKAELDSLKEVGGEAFDRRFAKQMVRDHKRALAILDRSRAQIKDHHFEALVAVLEPTLKSHEQIATNLLRLEKRVTSKRNAVPRSDVETRHAFMVPEQHAEMATLLRVQR
jgi:putative membrane protein